VPELSIVVPMYNEALGVQGFLQAVDQVMQEVGCSYEVICVNDGSEDETLAILMQMRQDYPQLRILDFSRNFGKELALTAGLEHSTGDAVIPMDADMQDPPDVIKEFITKWREGYEVVYGTRRTRESDTGLKRFTAHKFYKWYNRLSDVPIPENTGDFRLMDRKVVEAIKRLPERKRFMKGIFGWVGFKQTAVLYDRAPRAKGESKWNYWQLWNFAIDGVTSFSTFPLRVWSYLGVFVSLGAFAYAGFLTFRTMIHGVDVPGYASLMVALLLLSGLQMIMLGVLGEYVGRIYSEAKGRPKYIVRDAIGFEDADGS